MVAIVRQILVKQAYSGHFRSVFSVSLHMLGDCRNNILGDGFSSPIEFKKFHWACFPNFLLLMEIIGATVLIPFRIYLETLVSSFLHYSANFHA